MHMEFLPKHISEYTLKYYVHTHTDVIECTSDNGGCEQTCDNVPGSFTCTCEDGYYLETNRLNCSGGFLQKA